MLTIKIHRADGKVGTYSQPDAGAAERVLHRLAPDRIFASRSIAVGVKNPFNIINTEHVCWVELHTDRTVEYALPPGFERVSLLVGRAEYEAILARQWPKWRTTFAENDKGFLEALVEVSLIDGRVLYLHALGRSPMRLEELLEPQGAVVATFAPHGTVFINPRNVVRARIYHSENKVNYPNGLWFAEADDI
jgi:hypothetical protein